MRGGEDRRPIDPDGNLEYNPTITVITPITRHLLYD